MKAKPTVPDLKELFKQAAEIAKQVPESMREAAFNRAVDLLTQGIPPSEKRDPSVPGKRTRKVTQPVSGTSGAEGDPLADLLSSIDSTQHPGIAAASKVLDRALMVLQIAFNDHGVDGLTPPVIAEILTEKFRVRTTKHAVSMALAKATNLVNRIPHAKGFLYKIMSPGEAYLANAGVAEGAGSSRPMPRKRRVPQKKSSGTIEKSPTPKQIALRSESRRRTRSPVPGRQRSGPRQRSKG